MTWADGQAQKAAAYLERHEADLDGGVYLPGWAVEEAALMIRDFDAEIATLREVNAAQAEQLRKAQERIRAAEGREVRAWNEAIEAAVKACEHIAWTHKNAKHLGPEMNATACALKVRSLAKEAGE